MQVLPPLYGSVKKKRGQTRHQALLILGGLFAPVGLFLPYHIGTLIPPTLQSAMQNLACSECIYRHIGEILRHAVVENGPRIRTLDASFELEGNEPSVTLS